MNQLVIRTMAPTEITAVSDLLCDCYRWLGRRDGYNPEQLEFLLLRRGSIAVVQEESSRQQYLVACAGETVVGMVAIKDSEITKLYVAASHHRQGIGRRLYETAEQLIGAGGFAEVVLGTTPGSAPFYETVGMSIADRKPHKLDLFRGHEVLIMHKQLTATGKR